jgi:multiple antibiotic resistance protein
MPRCSRTQGLAPDRLWDRRSAERIFRAIDAALATCVTLFVTIDPIGTAPMFAALTANQSAPERRRTALRGVLIAAGVLVGFALVGEALLAAMGIGLEAFRIAGGVLLLLLSIEMVMVRHSGLRTTTDSEERESGQRADVSVFPLAIPLVAGPGAMTSVVLLMGAADGLATMALVLGELLLVLAVTLVCFLGAGRVQKWLGVTGVNVVTRVSGLLLAALAVQFVLDGLSGALAGNGA